MELLTEKEIYFSSSEEYTEIIKTVYERVEHKDNIDYIVGIPRGGSVAAIHLSYYFKSAQFKELGEFIKMPAREFKPKSVILVDDIIGTGETLKYVVNNLINMSSQKVICLNSIILLYSYDSEQGMNNVVAYIRKSLKYKMRTPIIPEIIIGKKIPSAFYKWIVFPYEGKKYSDILLDYHRTIIKGVRRYKNTIIETF